MTTSIPTTVGNYLQEQIQLDGNQEANFRKLANTLEEHARFINRKETAQYEATEVQTNATWIGANPQNKRQIFRKVVTGTVVTGANTIPHGIPTGGAGTTYNFTHISGVATNSAAPLWVALPNDTQGVTVDGTNVNIVATALINNFTVSITLEYYKV